MKSYTGSSCLEDAFEAGFEAAKKAKARDAKLAIVYASCDYDLKKVIKGVQEVLSCPIIGNTSFTGVIMPEGYVGGDKPFVGIMVLGGANLEVGVGYATKATAPRVQQAQPQRAKQLLMKQFQMRFIWLQAQQKKSSL